MSHLALKWLDKVAPKAELGRPIHRAVLWNLCWRYNDKHRSAWPRVSRIMLDTGYGRSGIQTALRELEAEGWITRHFRADKASRYALPPYERWVADGSPMPEDQADDEEEEASPGAQDVSPLAQGVSVSAQEVGLRGPGGEHRTTTNDTERHATSVKPRGGADPVVYLHAGPITDAQLGYLIDLQMLHSGYVVSEGERVNLQALTSAEASDEIQRSDRQLRAERPEAIKARIPAKLLDHLSQPGRTFYEELVNRRAA